MPLWLIHCNFVCSLLLCHRRLPACKLLLVCMALQDQLVEVVLDLGRPALARYSHGDELLSSAPLTMDELHEVVAKVSCDKHLQHKHAHSPTFAVPKPGTCHMSTMPLLLSTLPLPQGALSLC